MLLKRVSYGSGRHVRRHRLRRLHRPEGSEPDPGGELNRVAKLHQAEKAAEELAEAKPAELKQPSAPKRVKSEQGHHRGGAGQLPGEVLQVRIPVPGTTSSALSPGGTACPSTGATVPTPRRRSDPSRGRRGAGSRSPGAATPTTAIPRFWRWCARTSRACRWTSPPPSPRRYLCAGHQLPQYRGPVCPSSGWRSGEGRRPAEVRHEQAEPDPRGAEGQPTGGVSGFPPG